jgi:chemotaxis protein MotD
MEISAAYKAPAPARTDAPRTAARADDPSQDDFDAELTRAADKEPVREAQASKSPAPAKHVAETDAPKAPVETATDTATISAAPVNIPSPPHLAPVPTLQTAPGPAHSVGGAQPPAPKIAAQTSIPPGLTAAPAAPAPPIASAPETATDSSLASAPQAATASLDVPDATATSKGPNVRAASENAGTAAPNALAALAATAQPAQSPQPASKAISTQTKTAKPGGATEAAQTAATPSPLPSPAASGQQQAAAAQSSVSGQTPDQSKDASSREGYAAAIPATATGQTQTVPAQAEFKPDAGAAMQAPQPASPPAQNAPILAPALAAQNAPVIVPPQALGAAIARKALDGVNTFEIRLDPPELGRVDVTLEVDDSGTTRAHIRAERPEALELLQREAKGMEQALRQAGLQFDQSSLSFSLGGREDRAAQEHAHHGRRAKFNAVLPEDDIHAAALRGTVAVKDGLDLRV